MLFRSQWLLLENANSANASVLDRLNSLCEVGGTLSLDEKGEGSDIVYPHPAFRIFMTVDPHSGELSRAMRNRGVEIYLDGVGESRSASVHIYDAYRLPLISTPALSQSRTSFDVMRRSISSKIFPAFQSALPPCSSELTMEDSLSSYAFSYMQFLVSTVGSFPVKAIKLYAIRLFPLEYMHYAFRLIDWYPLNVQLGSIKSFVQGLSRFVKEIDLHQVLLAYGHLYRRLEQVVGGLKLQVGTVAYQRSWRC